MEVPGLLEVVAMATQWRRVEEGKADVNSRCRIPLGLRSEFFHFELKLELELADSASNW